VLTLLTLLSLLSLLTSLLPALLSAFCAFSARLSHLFSVLTPPCNLRLLSPYSPFAPQSKNSAFFKYHPSLFSPHALLISISPCLASSVSFLFL
jgi:hypothetical protein